MKPKILILCTGNSCRSHMAEGILEILPMIFLRYFCWINPKGEVHPLAIEALKEINIDIAHHTSDHLTSI